MMKIDKTHEISDYVVKEGLQRRLQDIGWEVLRNEGLSALIGYIEYYNSLLDKYPTDMITIYIEMMKSYSKYTPLQCKKT